MKKAAILFLHLTILSCMSTYAQPLGRERIHNYYQSVFEIRVNAGFPGTGMDGKGTGFFINDEGYALTCWHVIKLAFNSTNQGWVQNKTLHGVIGSAMPVEIRIPSITINAGKLDSTMEAYDIVLIQLFDPKGKPYRSSQSLALGNFEKMLEGDNILTAGYPFGFDWQTRTRGMYSTYYRENGIVQGLLDLTVNGGNSGGPAIRLGASQKEDAVIGVISNNITLQSTDLGRIQTDLAAIQTTDPALTSVIGLLKRITSAFAPVTSGISICNSINPIMELLKAHGIKYTEKSTESTL